MPFIIRANQRTEEPASGIRRDRLLTPDDTSDGRILIDRWHLAKGADLQLSIEPGTLAWLQVLGGEVSFGESVATSEIITRLPAPFATSIHAREASDLLISQVPDAHRFGELPSNGALVQKSFDWTREPVLQSAHDDRKRIYIATKSLFESSALKGEMVIYPAGATCPEHHHEGAEHYQFIVNGEGLAWIDGVEETLRTGDVLYNFENEHHWFRNDGDENFSFVEYFVPGDCKTVWAPGADICEWLPTGADIRGREPSRHIPQHAHGDQTPL